MIVNCQIKDPMMNLSYVKTHLTVHECNTKKPGKLCINQKADNQQHFLIQSFAANQHMLRLDQELPHNTELEKPKCSYIDPDNKLSGSASIAAFSSCLVSILEDGVKFAEADDSIASHGTNLNEKWVPAALMIPSINADLGKKSFTRQINSEWFLSILYFGARAGTFRYPIFISS